MSTHSSLHFDQFVSKSWSSPRSSPARWRGTLDHTCKYTICRRLLPRANSQQHRRTDDAQPTKASNVDIHLPYLLSEESIHKYQASGFVRLQNVFSATTLAHYRPTMSLEVANADKTPLEEDSDYQKAFTQVPGHCCYSLWKAPLVHCQATYLCSTDNKFMGCQ